MGRSPERPWRATVSVGKRALHWGEDSSGRFQSVKYGSVLFQWDGGTLVFLVLCNPARFALHSFQDPEGPYVPV